VEYRSPHFVFILPKGVTKKVSVKEIVEFVLDVNKGFLEREKHEKKRK
jgi:hypothetical protein